jgi:prepilin-type N-terminal cleavage/methylation domain-containing protein
MQQDRAKPKGMTGRKAVPHKQAGFTLLEVLIAATILAVGMAGVLPLFLAAISNNNRSRGDTQGTLVSQLFLEQIAALSVTPLGPTCTSDCSPAVSITDCAATPNTISISTNDPTDGSGTGANLDGSGNVDWTQQHSSVPSGYTGYYTSCGSGQITYEVRWNVKYFAFLNGVSGNPNPVKLINVSAKPLSTVAGTVYFATPTTLRAISGTH